MKRIYISDHKILMTIARYLDFKVMFSFLFSLIRCDYLMHIMESYTKSQLFFYIIRKKDKIEIASQNMKCYGNHFSSAEGQKFGFREEMEELNFRGLRLLPSCFNEPRQSRIKWRPLPLSP